MHIGMIPTEDVLKEHLQRCNDIIFARETSVIE